MGDGNISGLSRNQQQLYNELSTNQKEAINNIPIEKQQQVIVMLESIENPALTNGSPENSPATGWGKNSLDDIFASRAGIAVNKTIVCPIRTPDIELDGRLIGKDGKSYAPETELSQISAVEPKNGITSDGTVIYINGIMTTQEVHLQSLQAISNITGQKVVGIYNATEGFVTDAKQTLNDRENRGKNEAAATASDVIYNELKAGRSVHLMAHSQGGAITSRALTDVKDRLITDGIVSGLSMEEATKQAEQLLSKAKIETYAGAAARYPDGPQYNHYVNRMDSVPMKLGLGISEVSESNDMFTVAGEALYSIFTHPGKDAKVHFFSEGFALPLPHSFTEIYLPRRISND